jgi:3-dehydroquinate synthase
MVAAGQLAVELGLWDEAIHHRQLALITKTGLPTQLPQNLDIEAIVASLQTDKKVQDGKVRFILPQAIGSVQIRDDVPGQVLRQVLKHML